MWGSCSEMMATQDQFGRRLTTVLFADVVGYTRLTEADETGTHRALRSALSVISELVTTHEGVVAHYAGDAVLAEFASIVNGLNCAVEIQRLMAARNESTGASPVLRFRIGLNVGDVIDDEGEIYGDTVNTAVRLQSIAEPGGICISEAVRNAIGRRLPIAYEFVGEEHLKNLSIPVRAYRALLDASDVDELAVEPGPKPSVAVLPFENLSGTEKDADKLTEDLIRELSRFQGLEVVAHNSTFVYKGIPTKVQQIAEELGVGYVVEGHLHHAPLRMRVNVQLVSAVTGHHVWSEVYERAVNDAFGARDEIIRLAVAAIAGRIHVASSEDALHRPLEQLHAFEHVLRGQALVGKGRQGNTRARTHYHRALALEPHNARASAGIALSYIDDWWNSGSVDGALDLALAAAQLAYGADIRDSKVHWVLGLVHCLRRELRQSTRLIERANVLNPNDADGYAASTFVSLYKGDD